MHRQLDTPLTQVSAAGRLLEPHRVKNDVRDAADLCDLLRMGRLPEAYIASPGERELR